MRYFKSVIAMVFVGSLLGACLDPIDFELDKEFQDAIVIQGRIVKSEGSAFVSINISRLFDFTLESRIPISVNNVTLFDSKGNEMELTTRSPGIYRIALDETTPIQAEVGTSYQLRVRTIDGRTFQSTPELFTETPSLDSVRFAIVQEEIIDQFDNFRQVDRIQVSVDTETESLKPGGLYWEIRDIHRVTDLGLLDDSIRTCYVSILNVNKIFTLDPIMVSEGKVVDFPLISTPYDGTVVEGKYFEVKQYGLSEGAFAYWNAIDKLSERQGSVFDGPVGEVPTNFSSMDNPDDAVFGYFFASEERTVRRRVPQEFTEGLLPFCENVWELQQMMCFGENGKCICGICCNCLDFPNSTQERPTWWVD